MDRDEKIARLKAWLDENKKEAEERSRHALERQSFSHPNPETTEAQDKRVLRTYDAVYHELQRQEDKKIIEELGIFAMKG